MEQLIYSGKIREGLLGTLTEDEYEVVYCNEKKYAKLIPFPNLEYVSGQYRNLVNNSLSSENYFKLHDGQQSGYFNFIAKYLKRGMIVADCGCGAGSMLDLIKGYSKETIGVEPFIDYHRSLKLRGHIPFASIEEANQFYNEKVDLGISIHVIEHTKDPLSYLKSIFNLLKKDGVLILFTPNLDDILLKLIPKIYQPFFFRKVHNFYFTGESLEILGQDAGFSSSNKFYYHEFGFSNFTNWIKNGNGNEEDFYYNNSDLMNEMLRIILEQTGQSYNVGVILVK
jgi:2-polyprenyl-3-methyl-5-hydroxy-6-metoxy-1,4-benzoquinol methylase